MEIAIIIAAWVVCGVLAYGLTVHDFNRIWADFPKDAERRLNSHRRFGAWQAVFGPIGLLSVVVVSDRPYGFKW